MDEDLRARTKIKNGGPAFPLPLGTMNASEPEQSGGMSLRDYFSAHAPQEELAIPGTAQDCANRLGITVQEYAKDYGAWYRILAQEKYRYADAMLAEREKAFQ